MKHLNERFKCKKCDFQTSERRGLKNHIQTRDENHEKIVLKCPECSYETTSKSNISKHKKTKHTGESFLIKCKLCDFQSKLQSSITLHERSHSNKNCKALNRISRENAILEKLEIEQAKIGYKSQ